MCWKCDNPDGTIDEFLEFLRSRMACHGWTVQFVESARQPFAYTQPAMHIDFQGEYLLEVVEVDHPQIHLQFAACLMGPHFRALQLVWTDDFEVFPWDRGWADGRCRQPVFGRRCPLPA